MIKNIFFFVFQLNVIYFDRSHLIYKSKAVTNRHIKIDRERNICGKINYTHLNDCTRK